MPSPPVPVLPFLRAVPGQRIAALDDASLDDPVKRRAGVGALRSEFDEVADVVWRKVRPEIDDERAHRCLHDGLLARHFCDRERCLEWRRGSALSGHRPRAKEERENNQHIEIIGSPMSYQTSGITRNTVTRCRFPAMNQGQKRPARAIRVN